MQVLIKGTRAITATATKNPLTGTVTITNPFTDTVPDTDTSLLPNSPDSNAVFDIIKELW